MVWREYRHGVNQTQMNPECSLSALRPSLCDCGCVDCLQPCALYHPPSLFLRLLIFLRFFLPWTHKDAKETGSISALLGAYRIIMEIRAQRYVWYSPSLVPWCLKNKYFWSTAFAIFLYLNCPSCPSLWRELLIHRWESKSDAFPLWMLFWILGRVRENIFLSFFSILILFFPFCIYGDRDTRSALTLLVCKSLGNKVSSAMCSAGRSLALTHPVWRVRQDPRFLSIRSLILMPAHSSFLMSNSVLLCLEKCPWSIASAVCHSSPNLLLISRCLWFSCSPPLPCGGLTWALTSAWALTQPRMSYTDFLSEWVKVGGKILVPDNLSLLVANQWPGCILKFSSWGHTAEVLRDSLTVPFSFESMGPTLVIRRWQTPDMKQLKRGMACFGLQFEEIQLPISGNA